MPAGLPEDAQPEPSRDEQGRLEQGPGTSALARKGGLAKAEAMRLRALLGLRELDEGHDYRPYHGLAQDWRNAHLATLARDVGAGEVGPGPAAVVSIAARQMAAAQYLFDAAAALSKGVPTPELLELLMKASKLGDSSRQNLLAAHELTVKEAVGRKASSNRSPNEALAAAIEAGS